MQIVIKIPNYIHKAIVDGVYCGIIDERVSDAIKNGTPLPEGHGRLIDADALEEKVERHLCKHKLDGYDRDLVLHYTDVEMSPTIIEADKEKKYGI